MTDFSTSDKLNVVKLSVVFSIFDFKYGSLPAYSTIEEETAKKVALKSHLPLTLAQERNMEESEAVIPFPTFNQTGYVYLFTIPGKHERAEEHTASLTYLVDSSKKMELYRQIALLRLQAEEIVKYLKNNFIYEENKPLSRDIQEIIKSWGSLLDNAEISLDEQYVKRKITIKSSEIEPSFSFLFSIITKPQEFERLITGLYLGKPIFLASSNITVVDLCIKTLEEFVPHRTLRKIVYTEDPVKTEDADLIGINRPLMKLYSKELILDLDKGRVFNGERSTFVERMLKDIKDKNQQNAVKIITERILWLLDQVSQLTEAFVVPEDKMECEKGIQKIIREAPDALNIVIEMAAAASPVIEERMRSEMGRWKERALDFTKRGW
ncbi:MAG: hypothetical protein ACFFBD_03505 [Candidatus Hodarchaeota archaeon]